MAKKASKKTAEPKREKPKHNDEQYGEVLYSYSFNMDEVNLLNASGLVGSSRMQQIFTGVSMVQLMLLIASLYNRENPNYPLAIICFVSFIVLGIASQNWPRIRDWYVSTSNLVQEGDSARHVVVTADKIVVEGPDEMVAEYRISEVKKVSEDSDGALAKLGGKRYVYIPREAMSDSRYVGLVKHLRTAPR